MSHAEREAIYAPIKEQARKAAVLVELRVLRDLLCDALGPVLEARGMTLGPRYLPVALPTHADVRSMHTMRRSTPLLGGVEHTARTNMWFTTRALVTDLSLADTLREQGPGFVQQLVDKVRAESSMGPTHTVVCVGACWDQKETATVSLVFAHPADLPSDNSCEHARLRQSFDPAFAS